MKRVSVFTAFLFLFFLARSYGEETGPSSIIWEDTSGKGLPVKDVRVGQLCLGKHLLSGSRLVLYPDRLGVWEYDFGMRVLPDEFVPLSQEKRSEYIRRVFPFCKHIHDPVEPFKSAEVHHNQRILRIAFRQRRVRQLTYPIDFGPEFRLVGLLVRPWKYHEDGTFMRYMMPDKNGRFVMEAVVSEDREAKKVIASVQADRQTIYTDSDALYMKVPNLSSCYITLRMREGKYAYFSGGGLEAFVRYTGTNWPKSEQEKGMAIVRYQNDMLFPGFEGNLSALNVKASGCNLKIVPPESCPDAFLNGGGLLRITPADTGEKYLSVALGVPEPYCDWSRFRAVRIVYRVPTACGRVQMGLVGVFGDNNYPRIISTGAPCIIPAINTPRLAWQTHEKTLPLENTEKIRSLTLHAWGPSWRTGNMFERYCLEIGALELIMFRAGEKEELLRKREEEAAWHKAGQNSPLFQQMKELPLPRGEYINPRDVFARGVWGVHMGGGGPKLKSIGCNNIWDYRDKVMDDLKAHHLNAVHLIGSCSDNELEAFVKLAHKKGLLLWGTRPSIIHREQRVKEEWPRFRKQFRQHFSRWKGVPTFLAWAVSEEPKAWMLPYLAEVRKIMKEVGAQPYIMIYNSDVMQKDCTNEPIPSGVARDCYPFHVNSDLRHQYLRHLRTGWKAAKEIGGVFWMVPQLNDHGIRRAPTRAEMRFQVWTALAYNVKGFFPWMYHSAKSPDFSDRDFYGYYSDEMVRVAAMERLLVAMQRDDDLQLLENRNEKILIGNFIDRKDPRFRFAVLANLDTKVEQALALIPKQKSDVILEIACLPGQIRIKGCTPEEEVKLLAGNGTILFVGPEKSANRLRIRYWGNRGNLQ